MSNGMWIKDSSGNFVFDSRKKTGKDFMRGFQSFSVGSGAEYNFVLAHGFGQYPSFKAYLLESTGVWVPIIPALQTILRPDNDYGAYAYTDATNLYVDILNGAGGTRTISIKYFLFKNKIL